ncbi:hypothetical protein GUJ93_ZPchr0003g16475 [Zizania palustris]|uniref:Uncharacterized protein n=1 Tax=Zizania palustris TaxID=103762 RepID=A0A8J5VIL2_ZIZPA|nr:hypothetical protein GUJ93_ZPchr0003g16475 [Zizania palustris]
MSLRCYVGTLRASLSLLELFPHWDYHRNLPHTRASSLQLTPRGLAEPLTQCLPLEPIPVSDHKQSRATELRWVLGITVEAEQLFRLLQTKLLPSIASEEFKRIRGGVMESSTKAMEKTKSLQESIQKLDRYRNAITRRQQRSEGGMTERSLGSGSGSLRMGARNNAKNPGQRLEERAKSATTSKHVRSSLAADAWVESGTDAANIRSILREALPLAPQKQLESAQPFDHVKFFHDLVAQVNGKICGFQVDLSIRLPIIYLQLP